ncbi:ABC transporter ATP-binding protein [Shouchella clausii]|uniref:ABC transporter ATP-binding protein n=1 Tax=Shouchella clausii TaxID=79880 RepID=UPI00398306BF
MVIDLENVSFQKAKKPILQDISWQVRPGEQWAILGANGSGKTSLLKLITGYEWASAGRISVLGSVFGSVNIHELRKRVGWVSASLDQRYQMHEGMPCADVIVSGIHASIGVHEAITKADGERALALARSMGLEHVAFSPLSQLSQGERKKAFMARALINEPELLILDEATSGLDLSAREQLLAEVERMLTRKQAPTLLYVTHYPEEILPSISHVLLLKKGRVLAAGRKEEVLTASLVSEALGLPLTVEWANGRPWVKATTAFAHGLDNGD